MNDNAQLLEAIRRITDNFPAREDVQFFEPDTDIVAALTSLTITWTLRRDFEIVITELYCDSRADCEFLWIYAGILYHFNEVSFSHGKRIREGGDYKITLKVSNLGVADQDIAYFLKGWARRK